MRLDTAAQLARLQPQALVAVSGGVDFNQHESEGSVMARYLAERHGMQPAALVEEVSTSTELNLELSKPLLQARGIDVSQPIAIVSSDFTYGVLCAPPNNKATPKRLAWPPPRRA